MNVIEEVVDKNWCIGCGMCAAVCPKNRLDIRSKTIKQGYDYAEKSLFSAAILK